MVRWDVALDLSQLPATAAELARREPADIVTFALREYSPDLGLSFSGAEDVVLIDMAAQAPVCLVHEAGVASVYVMANVATLISHVPGGLGVIESVVLMLLPGTSMLGALIVFRVVYFIIPLALGSMLLALTELFRTAGHESPVKAAPPAAKMK